MESRIHCEVYVRFGGEHPETGHHQVSRRWMLSLLDLVGGRQNGNLMYGVSVYADRTGITMPICDLTCLT